MDLKLFYSQNQMTLDEAVAIEKKHAESEMDFEKLFVPDPGTIIQAYEFGKSVYDMFGGGDGDLDEVLDYMKREFKIVKQLLNDVLLKLNELKVFIKEESRINAVNNLGSILRIFNESYSTWYKNPNDEHLKTEASDVLLKLREYNRTAQEHGYAHFHTIWIAVLYERSLLKLLKKPSDEVQRIFLNHAIYFNEALSNAITGSITYIFLQKVEEIKQLDLKFSTKEYNKIYNEDAGVLFQNTFSQKLVIKGDLYSGYEYSIKNPVLIARTRTEGHVSGGSGGGGHKSVLEIQGVDVDFAKIINSYKKARKVYLNTLFPQYMDMKKAVETCQFYYNEIVKMSNNP
jgi:hypothetical protein